MKRPRGAWRRGNLLSLLLVGQMLLAGCSFEARLQRQADGRYAEEATIALSSAELRSVGGEAVVEQYLDLVEQSFVVLGGSYRWWKEPTGDGVRFRIQSEAAQPAGNLAPLASFSQSMVTWQSTPDGQWRLQQSIDLTGADLQAAGGEALLDQSFNQACGAQLFGEMCQWWKVPIGSGVRYTMSIGGAAWDPSQVLIPGLPPLPGLQPDGLEEPEAELPAAVSPSDPEARRWLDEKSRLIPSMEVMDIPADPFSLPAVAGYDEAAARDLLQRISDQLDRGQLAVEQLEAFKRLTIQERSLSQMLPPYAGIEASIADTLIDTVETLWGLVNVLGPLLDGAKAASPIVDAAADKVLEKSWELIRDVGRLAVDVLGSESDQRETASKAWDMGLRLIEDRYFGGMSLLDLLKDNVVEIAVTTALIQPYRSRMQALLDRGVRTADLTSTAQDRWPISGTTQSAEYLSRSLVDRAGWEREAADTRHQDFQRGVDVLKVAEDVTALATLTPLAALAKIVNIGAGVEHMLVNVPELLLNGRNAECVDYLSRRLGEMAFVADQPAESCRDRSQAQPGQSGRAALLAQPGAPPLGQLAAQLGSQAGRYRQRLGELVQVAGAGDLRSVEGTLAQFAQAEESLWDGLDQARRALLEKESLGDADLDLLATSGALKARELAVYLAVAETVMARQQGVPPQTDLRQLAQQVQLKLDEVVQAAGQTDLTLPAGTPVLRIRAVSLHAGATQPLRLDVDLENAGNAPADGVEVALLLDGALSGAPAALGTVGTGERKQATLVAPSPTGPLATVQVRSQGRLMDSYLVRVPDELLAPRAGPAAPSRSAPAAPQAPVSGPSSAALIGLAVLGVAVLGGAGVLLASRSPSGPAASQRAGSARLARGGALTIGRDPRCELALPDPKVSHRHACITGGPSGYLLADLGSRNGSWVNGQRVQQQLLRAGDVIRLGDTELIFHVDRRGRPQLAPRAASPGAPGPADRTAPGASRLGVAYLSDGVQRYPIPPAGCAIGRSPECAISLRDAYVARRHARLDWRGGAWVLTDLGSAGGTYVNGRRVRQHALRPGDEVRLGETLLRFG